MSLPESPAAPATETGQWWRNTVVYQVYPRSFADSNGDGIGDLPGITSHLDSLKDLGVDSVWISPFYPSPQADAGYDVTDYRDVDPMFGTLADFDEMLARAHRLGLKLIVDLVPNHSSDHHVWFRAALAAAPGSSERARYIFRDGRGPGGDQAPNNWLSVFGGPAWERTTNPDGTPGQWYLHLFNAGQPDFDWDNAEVRSEFESVMRFWLDRGVDGFRVDVAHGLVKAPGLPDYLIDPTLGVMSFASPTAKDARKYLDGAGAEDAPTNSQLGPMWDQNGVHDIYRQWRGMINEYSPERVLVAEAWVQPLTRLSNYVRADEMHKAFNFTFLETPWYGPILQDVVTRSLQINNRVGAPTTWVLSNHDVVRHTSRYGLPDGARLKDQQGIGIGDTQPDAAMGLTRARAMTLFMLGLPGSSYLYQGEELGLPEHTTLPDNMRQDPTWEQSAHERRGRDGCRVPIPWQADAPALGFSSSGKSWLPQPESFATLSRDLQEDDPNSTLTLYRDALALRRNYALGDGKLEWLTHPGGRVLAFSNGSVTVMINMSGHEVPLPPGEVIIASVPLKDDGALPADATAWLV
ncbi:MAG: glycoside hydrolase family 13 protein [Nakamurella sp.]